MSDPRILGEIQQVKECLKAFILKLVGGPGIKASYLIRNCIRIRHQYYRGDLLLLRAAQLAYKAGIIAILICVAMLSLMLYLLPGIKTKNLEIQDQ